MSARLTGPPVDPPHLMHPREAIHILSPLVGDDDRAKSLLVSRVIDYSLKLEARWIAHQLDIGPLPQGIPKESKTEFGSELALKVLTHPKGPGHFLTVGGGIIDLCRDPTVCSRDWHWGAASFVYRTTDEVQVALSDGRSGSTASRWVISDARFRNSEIEALAASFSPQARAGSARNTGVVRSQGEFTPSEAWRNWVAEVVAFNHDEGIDPDMTANKLSEKIMQRAEDTGLAIPSRGTVYHAAQTVVTRMKKAHAGD